MESVLYESPKWGAAVSKLQINSKPLQFKLSGIIGDVKLQSGPRIPIAVLKIARFWYLRCGSITVRLPVINAPIRGQKESNSEKLWSPPGGTIILWNLYGKLSLRIVIYGLKPRI